MSRDVCEHFNPIDQPCDQCDERGFPNALFLARELNAPIGTQSTYSTMKQAAAELRRLHDLVTEDSILQRRQRDEIAELKAELAEQARLVGMGSEREARLMALNAELVRALEKIWDEASTNCGYIGMSIADIADAALAKVEASE